jgi:nucleoside-diphosphate-sugar epimerase
MRILIAGCGDVGSILAISLLQDGHVVYGLKRNTSSLPDGVLPIQADLTKPDTLTQLPADIDHLVFMPTPSSRDQAGYEAIFIQGWKNLWAGLSRAPERAVVVSSTAVFGETNGAIVDEETDPRPTGFNGKALLKMEHTAAACTDHLVVVRLSGIYGPGRERLIRMAASKGLEIQQSPPYFTNRIHSNDAAAVLKHLLLIDKPHALYAATDNLPAPRYEVVEWLARQQGAEAPQPTTDESASRGKRVNNQRLQDSGFELSYPDYRTGYGAVLKARELK